MNIIIYDTTCGALSILFTWFAWLYRKLGWADYSVAIPSWQAMFDVLETCRDRSIKSVQYWGHGYFGTVLCNHEELNTAALLAVSKKLRPGARWWWRTCLSFAGSEGRLFAYRCANLLGCVVIGHTYIIWLWQSGVHLIRPGDTPSWPIGEGWSHHGGERVGQWSWPWSPETVSALSKGVRDES